MDYILCKYTHKDKSTLYIIRNDVYTYTYIYLYILTAIHLCYSCWFCRIRQSTSNGNPNLNPNPNAKLDFPYIINPSHVDPIKTHNLKSCYHILDYKSSMDGKTNDISMYRRVKKRCVCIQTETSAVLLSDLLIYKKLDPCISIIHIN